MAHLSTRIITSLIILLSGALLLREAHFQQRLQSQRPPITVYVLGEVVNPGPVTLPEGARCLHALTACGGVTAKADLRQASPARYLNDGETLYIAARPSETAQIFESEPRIGGLPSKKTGPDRKNPGGRGATAENIPSSTPDNKRKRSTIPSRLNLNLATVEELQQVPGIGPTLALRIIKARQERPKCTFERLEDLTAIRGIKRKTLARLKPYLELEGI